MSEFELNSESELDLLLDPRLVKKKFAIEEEELNALRQFGQYHQKEVTIFIDEFYEWMHDLPEFSYFFKTNDMIEQVKQKQILYWRDFLKGDISVSYLKTRAHIGAIHAKIGLPIYSYCAAMNFSFAWWDKKIEAFRLLEKMEDVLEAEVALVFHKLIQLDVTIITQTYHHNTQKKLQETLKSTQKSVENVTRITNTVVEGDYSTMLEDDGSELNIAINMMIEKLDHSAKENKRDTWLKTGQAQLAEKLRGDLELVDLANIAINFITTYLGAQTGVFYTIEQENILKLLASHAYSHRKNLSNEFQLGEGLIGQVVLERKTMIVDDLPEGYLTISSGLGSAKSTSILIAPFVLNDEVKGVIELGTFGAFKEIQIEFLEMISENMAVAIETAMSRKKMQALLDESQLKSKVLEMQQKNLESTNQALEEKAVELKASEEELKTQSEQLQAANEELEEKTQDLEEQKINMEKKNNELESSKKMLEKKAKELQMSGKYKTEFLSNMSHELRTPLNSLLILAQNLCMNDEGNLNEDQIKAANIIYNSGKDLLHLINDILDLSKIESGKLIPDFERVSLSFLVDSCFEKMSPIAEDKNIKFKVKLQDDIPEKIITDTARAEQILKNLLSNAIKFTDSGGAVNFTVYTPDEKELSQHDLTESNVLAFAISDTGIGIAEDKREIIFEAFKQSDGSTNRKYGGTGLGLAISQRLAKELGGKIVLESVLDKGSTFTLYLVSQNVNKIENDTQNKSNHTSREAKQEKSISTTSKILLIEDDENFLRLFKSAVTARGFTHIIAKDGETGFALAKSEQPDAIVLDIGLPDINGIELLDKFKKNKRTKNIPIHIVSGSDVKQASLEKGAIGYIQKPLDKEQLDQLISKAAEIITEPVQNVLIVEDNATQSEQICSLLESDNLLTVIAETGKKAIALLEKQRFHCMILDLNLPDISGEKLLKEIKENANIILPPLIVYTAQDISKKIQKELEVYTPTIVIKSADAPNRLKEELSLFLHELQPIQDNHIKAKKPAQELNGRKILLVDDDMRNNIALGVTLRKQGLEVLIADNGELALEQLSKDDAIELILMDIMMPVMDGYTAMRNIRNNGAYSNVPIIALTAKAMAQDKQKCIEAGASDYLAKPVELERLFSLMKVWLKK